MTHIYIYICKYVYIHAHTQPGTYKDLTGNNPCVNCPTGKHGYTTAATSDEFCRKTYKIKFGASMISNHPSATGADTGGTVRYGGTGAYGEWAVDKDATNFDATDTWNGPTGGNPGGRTVYDEHFGEWHAQHKVDSHHHAANQDENLDEYLGEHD
jgi:hypothetical protein